MDVFCLAIGVAVAEMGIVADYTLSHQPESILTVMRAFCGGASECLTVAPRILPGFWLSAVAVAMSYAAHSVVFGLSAAELLDAERSSAALCESDRLDRAIESLALRMEHRCALSGVSDVDILDDEERDDEEREERSSGSLIGCSSDE
jgi:hypothetical protein